MGTQSREDFVELVKRAEREIAAKPKIYHLKLGLFAALGYAVILGTLVALVGLAGGLVAMALFSTGLFLLLLKKKILLLVLVGIWVLLRALWVKFPAPEGYNLSRREFPRLFAELDQLKKQLQTVKIHRVILSNEYNASVVQYPRLGVLGWYRNYLILGYPLLLTLSPEQMRSVLAHEFGHLSGNHGRFAGWIYRVRMSWFRLLSAFENANSWGAGLMGRFFAWYSPRFEAYSFALARSNEYQADAIAAELTSPIIVGSALVNVHATGPLLDDCYWRNYFRQAETHPEPPHAPFSGLRGFIANSPLPAEDVQACILKRMRATTHYGDTHPSLSDRLRALNVEPVEIAAPDVNAADEWLGSRHREVMEFFDGQWLRGNRDAWIDRHAYVSKSKQELEGLSARAVAELSDEELWSRAYWTHELESDDAAFPLFQAYQERRPDDTDVAFMMGGQLLKKGDDRGLELLAKARSNPGTLWEAARLGFQYLQEAGRVDEAEAWWREALEQDDIFVAAQRERDGVTTRDKLVVPEIGDELLTQIIECLKKHPKVAKAWLAQKPVEFFPDRPVYVIAFTDRGFSWSTAKLQASIAAQLNMNAYLFVAYKGGDTKDIAKKVIKKGKRIL